MLKLVCSSPCSTASQRASLGRICLGDITEDLGGLAGLIRHQDDAVGHSAKTNHEVRQSRELHWPPNVLRPEVELDPVGGEEMAGVFDAPPDQRLGGARGPATPAGLRRRLLATRQPRHLSSSLRCPPAAGIRGLASQTTGVRRYHIDVAQRPVGLEILSHIIPLDHRTLDCPPNTGDKLRASNMLNARLLHPLVRRLVALASNAGQPCHSAISASLAFTSLRTSVAGNGARAENRMVPGLVSYSANSARSVATVVPLIG